MPMTSLRYLPIAFVFLGILATASRADEPLPSPASEGAEKEEIKIFMRISEELFEELTQEVVEMTMPVQKRVEGMPLRGQATGKGVTSIELDTSNEEAKFLITVTGTAVASLRSDVGPAIAKLSSRAQFTARKEVQFDGITFRSLPAGSETCNDTKVDRVCAKRQGPVGRLIERVGQRIADKLKPEINSIAEDISRDMLAQAFDDLAAELISELNQTTKFEETVDKFFPEMKDWKYRLATRPNYLLAGLGPANASFPEFLSAEGEQPEALMEMWLPLTAGQTAILKLVGDLDIAHDLLSEFLSEEEAKEIAEDVELVRRGEWSVIQIGLPKPETTESPGS